MNEKERKAISDFFLNSIEGSQGTDRNSKIIQLSFEDIHLAIAMTDDYKIRGVWLEN